MEMVSRAKRTRKTLEVEPEHHDGEDRISSLSDGVLGDIVSFLPTMDGACTQVLSSRWRHLWRSSPLHLDLDDGLPASEIPRILAAHPGPGRRFSVPQDRFDYRDMPDAATIDTWLRSPALDGLQELEFHNASHPRSPPPSLPASVHRFSSTLRVASLGGFSFPDQDGGGATANGLLLRLPVLEQLSLSHVSISESSLRALLASCPVLQSLMLNGRIGCSRVEIASATLRSIGLCSGIGLQELIIQDAPCLQRLLLDSLMLFGAYGIKEITVSVVSAPNLHALGPLSAHGISLKFDTTIFQRPWSIKVLALIQEHLSLDAVIESIKCFPCLEKLYIKTKMAGEKNLWQRKYKRLTSSLDIRLKKIVLTEYRGNASHVNFAKFFVLNARMLEYMRLDLYHINPSSAWIDKQHRRLQIKDKASRHLQLDFASSSGWYFLIRNEEVHDLSTADPFS